MTLPTSFAPAIAAIVVRKWITREGFLDAGLTLDIRKAWRYYLLASSYPAFVVPMTLIFARAEGAGPADFSGLSGSLFLQMPFIVLISTPIVWGEEFGWRGYLQVRLFPTKPLLAAVATGLIWGVWHYPMILMGYIFLGNLLGLLLYPANMIVTSLFYGWLRARSGTVWTATLAHAAANTVINPLLESLLPNAEWAVVWSAYRLPALALPCAYILVRGQIKRQPQTVPC